jgi:hypothetical protein
MLLNERKGQTSLVHFIVSEKVVGFFEVLRLVEGVVVHIVHEGQF